jgi:large subunit ribosomal protein L32
MPAEPKKRKSKAAKRTRRASIKLSGISMQKCPNCKESTLAHQACVNCGRYGNKSIETKRAVKITKA